MSYELVDEIGMSHESIMRMRKVGEKVDEERVGG